MSFTMLFWDAYRQLWYGLKSIVFLLLILSSLLRALYLKSISDDKWYIGFIPLFGETRFNNEKKAKRLFIISAILFILSNGMYSWLLLIIGVCTGYVAEYLTATEKLNEEKPVLYGICPIYRYYIWVTNLLSHSEHDNHVECDVVDTMDIGIRMSTDTTKIVDKISK